MAKICNVWRFLLYGFMLVLFVGYDSYAATCSDENGEILFPAGAVTVPSAQELYNNGVIKAVNTSSNNEIYDLDAYVAGEEWSVYFPESNKTISGVAVCGPSGKSKYIAGQSSSAYISTEYPGTPTNPPVAYLGCFCKLGGINDDTNYASAGQMGGSGSTAEAKLNNCRANCPSVCANYMATDAAFRAAIYGGADNCPVGTPGDGGGSEPETCDKTATDFCDVNASCEYVLNSEFSVGYTMDVSDDYCYATPNQYTISLSLDGANISETISVYYDIEISDLPTPTMDGKSFQGWFDGNGNQYSNGMVYNVAGDITLYAKWGRDCEFPIGDAISQTPSAGTSLSLPTVATLASQNPSDFTYSGGVYTISEGNGMAVYNADQRFSVKYENGLLWGTAFCGPNGSGDKTKLYYTNPNKGLTAYQAGKGCWCRYGLDDDRITDFPWERAATMNNADDCRATCPSVCANYTATDSTFRSILLNEDEESGTCPVMDNSVQCEEQDGYDAAYNESTGECEYTAHVYTITLDTGEVVSVDIETPVASVSVPAKSGYRFGGYYTQPSGAGVLIYDENGDFALTTTAEKLDYLLKNQTLYANWIEAFCTDDDGMVVWNSVDSVMDTAALLSSGVVSKKESSAENVYEIHDFAAYTADQRWAVYFQEYGTVTGSAFCGPRGSKAPGEAVSDVLTGNAGATVAQAYSGCYCRYGDPEPDQPWVKAADYYSSGDDWATRTDTCRMNCSAKCAEMIATDSDFRTTLYGGANNCPVGSDDPILCSPGQYMDSGICTSCPDGYTSDAGATAQNQCYQSCNAKCKVPASCSAPNATCEYEVVQTPGKQYYGDTACVGYTCHLNKIIICNDGYELVDDTCQKQCTDDEMLIDGTCVEPEFTITTTEMSAGATFSFKMSASGVFYVDFDDGRGVQKIDRNHISKAIYTSAAYADAGAHTIKMYGDATGYTTSSGVAAISFQDNKNIKTVDGSLGAIFGGNTPYMLYRTFSGCTSLESIPADLFSGVTGSSEYMFDSTFRDCTSLASLPDGLFKNIEGKPATSMFKYTFNGCTNLSGYIPADTFAKMDSTDFNSATMGSIFASTALDTSCPAGTTQYITGFESAWNGKVACAPCPDGICDIDPLFTIKTTPIQSDDEFSFRIAATGTFYIDWGDDTGIEKIVKTNVDSELFTHKYTNASESYTIGMTGYAETYAVGVDNKPVVSFAGNEYIQELSGSIAAIFGGSVMFMFENTFKDCINLEKIPATLFDGVSAPAESLFNSTFHGCSKLADIPDGLFDLFDGTEYDAAQHMFMETFLGCASLTTVPENLFNKVSGGAYGLFKNTFKDCTGITSLYPNMFVNITTPNTYMFEGTFHGCTSLSSVPSQLFQNVSGGADYMFYSTFRNCTGLTEIQSGLFNGINTNAQHLFDRTFLGCTSLTEIPNDLFNGITTTDNASFMFIGTFEDCTSLTHLPERLFANIQGVPADSMFDKTFKGCDGLLGYINPDFFALLDMNDVSVSSVMDETFTNTTLVKKCPSGTYRVKANFGYTLSGRAVCSPCDAGNMSFAGANMCYVPRKLHINDNDTIDITVNLLPEKPAATLGMAFDIPNAGVYYGCLTTDENRTINNDTDKKMHIEYENQHYLMYDCTAQ